MKQPKNQPDQNRKVHIQLAELEPAFQTIPEIRKHHVIQANDKAMHIVDGMIVAVNREEYKQRASVQATVPFEAEIRYTNIASDRVAEQDSTRVNAGLARQAAAEAYQMGDNVASVNTVVEPHPESVPKEIAPEHAELRNQIDGIYSEINQTQRSA